jgi:hypothetical protein
MVNISGTPWKRSTHPRQLGQGLFTRSWTLGWSRQVKLSRGGNILWGLTFVMQHPVIMAARRGRCTPNPLQHRHFGVDVTAKPALEVKQRLEKVRDQLTGTLLTDEKLRLSRAIEILEQIGTPDARQVLQRLADGAPQALATTAARAALKRLGP